MEQKEIQIKNKKALFNYDISEKYIAGISLLGTEIKSIRNASVTLSSSFCVIENNEIYIKGMNISQYLFGNINNHEPDRVRKLLLKKIEINQIKKKVKEKKMILIPTKLFINARGYAKIEIGLGRGKKIHDKREDIKQRDIERKLRGDFKIIIFLNLVYGGTNKSVGLNGRYCLKTLLLLENSLNPYIPWHLPKPLLFIPPKGRL